MVGWHHWHNGHGFQQALGVSDGQGGLACCSPWGRKELDTTEWLNWTEETKGLAFFQVLLHLVRNPGREFSPCWLKKTHIQKLGVMFYLGTWLRTRAWGSTSQIALRNCFKEVKGEIRVEVVGGEDMFKKKIKKLLLITKNRYLKLTILVHFYVWEDLRVWAHWNYSFEMHVN